MFSFNFYKKKIVHTDFNFITCTANNSHNSAQKKLILKFVTLSLIPWTASGMSCLGTQPVKGRLMDYIYGKNKTFSPPEICKYRRIERMKEGSINNISDVSYFNGFF